MSRPIKVTMSIGSEKGGWNEIYFLKADIVTPAAALPIAKNLAWGRTAFFANNVFLDYVRCSQVGPKPDKRTVEFDYPLAQHPSWSGGTGTGDIAGPTNDPTVCFQMAGETVSGQWGNRYFRGINDNWVTQSRLTTGILAYLQMAPDTGSDPDLSPTGGIGSHLGICQGFWRLLQRRVALATRNTAIDYTLGDVVTEVYRGITNKKVGRRFGVSRGRRPSTLVT